MSPLASLPVLSGREVCAILTRHGFAKVRQKGSHISMQKQTATRTVTVSVPDKSELNVGTLLSIIRKAGLTKQDFRR